MKIGYRFAKSKQMEDRIQVLADPFAHCIMAGPQPFCLQPGHKDNVARGVRPDFARRVRRGEEAHVSMYFGMIFVGWFPSLAIFGTLAGIIGRGVAGDAGGIAGMILGALVVPVGSVFAALTGRRELRRRKELYSRGQLITGWVTGFAATDHYYCRADHPDALPERTGAFVVAISFAFENPTGYLIHGHESAVHDVLPSAPERGTPIMVLFLNDDHCEVL